MKKEKQEARSRKQEFEIPKIIGIISERAIPKSFEKSLSNQISRLKLPYICLPFRVESRYLKNVIACMQLMDIESLIILGNHTQKIKKLMRNLDKSAREARAVNVIKRSKRGFKGYHFDQKVLSYREVVNFLTSP